jgi:predicted lipoprotein with Yx(FWY)xxD motif
MVIVTKDTPVLGYFLMDDKGLTLYTFIKDTAGTSTCNSKCAAMWPPLSARVLPTGGPGVWRQFALIKRPDGTLQVTYNRMPLYYFSGDKKPGDIKGEGIGGFWFAATP